MNRNTMRRAIQLLTGIFAAGSTSSAAAKTLFDYFQTTPIVGKVAQAPWGASNVQPRDQDNGLEDKTMKSWSYWDGRIVKAADGKYHLFCSRWDQSAGHWNGWPNSVCTHSISASSPLGPYIQQGDCYTDAGGKGHNVMAGQLADSSYFILVSETRRPAPVYSSKSLDGPWTALGGIKTTANGFPDGNTSSNTTFWANPDGSILGTSRDGIMMVSTSGLAGPYVLKTNSVYDASIKYVSGGTPEDPCLWYSGGQYHMVYSYPLDRKMYHLTSPDGIKNWKDMGLAVDATKPFIKYTDGTTNIWNKLERPQVYLEDGHVKYFTFAAIDVDKGDDNGNDNHGSKVIVVPFDGVTFDAETGIGGAGGTGGGTGTARDAGADARSSGGATGGGGGVSARGGVGGTGTTVTASGGASSTGGASGSGGTAGAGNTGGSSSSGGRSGSGGASATGGASGAAGAGGQSSSGGAVASGGATSSGGARGSGGAPSTGGTIGAGGSATGGAQSGGAGGSHETTGTASGSSNSGCSCAIGSRPAQGARAPLVILLVSVLLLGWRRARRARTGGPVW